jgi:hypothetical protein
MKSALLIASLVSAIIFGTIFLKPAAPAGHAPKAWAHGTGYVLPRIIGTLSFAGIAIILLGVTAKKNGARMTFRHPAVLTSLVLLLPAVYTLLFVIRVIIALTTGIYI